jgi:hypothetical protein
MQFRYFSLLLVAAGILLGVQHINAQVIRENSDGERIIVYPDGSWQYFSDYSNGLDIRYGPDEDGKKEDKYPIFDGEIAPLEGAIPVTIDDLKKIATRRMQLAQEAADVANKRAVEAEQQVAYLEAEYQKAASSQNEDAIEELTIRLNASKKTADEARREALQAQAEVQRAESVTRKGNYVEAYQKAQKQKKARLSNNSSNAISYNTIFASNLEYFDIPSRQNVMTNPPKAECQIGFEGEEKYSGQKRRDVKKAMLFTHTDDALRLFLKDKDYLRCEGNLSSIAGGYRFLSLEFTFAYPNAREAYGFIEKGSVLTIKLLNGDFVNLKSGKMDRGSYDTESELLTYRVHYPLDNSQIGLLKNSEVDAIRVFWSSGFEEYEVYHMDFFMNQISCLEQ